MTLLPIHIISGGLCSQNPREKGITHDLLVLETDQKAPKARDMVRYVLSD